MLRVNRDRRDRCAGLGIARTTIGNGLGARGRGEVAGSVHTDNLLQVTVNRSHGDFGRESLK
jgi:hypothetical protein